MEHVYTDHVIATNPPDLTGEWTSERLVFIFTCAIQHFFSVEVKNSEFVFYHVHTLQNWTLHYYINVFNQLLN